MNPPPEDNDNPVREIHALIAEMSRHLDKRMREANDAAIKDCIAWHWKGREQPTIGGVAEQARLVFYPQWVDDRPKPPGLLASRHGLESKTELWAYDWIIRIDQGGHLTTEGPRVAVHSSAR